MNTKQQNRSGLAAVYAEYMQALKALYRRREEVAAELGAVSKRYETLEEEIDEMEEDMMRMRVYLP